MINSTFVNIRNENRDLFCGSKAEFIDQQQTQHGSSGYDINYDQFVAQSFKPSVKMLSKVDLNLFRYGGVPKYKLVFSGSYLCQVYWNHISQNHRHSSTISRIL